METSTTNRHESRGHTHRTWRILGAIDLHGCDPARLEAPDSIPRFLPTLVVAVGMRAHGPLPSSNGGRSPDPTTEGRPMRFPRPTYGSVTATIALFVALGGTSYAAVTISGSDIRNSTVTGADVKNGSLASRDIANGSLTGSDLKNRSVTGSDVKDASLVAADFKPGELPAGPAGPAGPQGPVGPSGATHVVARRTETVLGTSGGAAVAEARCLPGEVAVGGGAGMNGPLDGTTAVLWDVPREADGTVPEEGETATRWAAGGANSNPVQQRTMSVFVLCAAP